MERSFLPSKTLPNLQLSSANRLQDKACELRQGWLFIISFNYQTAGSSLAGGDQYFIKQTVARRDVQGPEKEALPFRGINECGVREAEGFPATEKGTVWPAKTSWGPPERGPPVGETKSQCFQAVFSNMPKILLRTGHAPRRESPWKSLSPWPHLTCLSEQTTRKVNWGILSHCGC